jgi:hypothetical protein
MTEDRGQMTEGRRQMNDGVLYFELNCLKILGL